MDLTQHDSRYSWARLAISLALSVVGSIGMWAVIVVLPAMQADFGIGRGAATIPGVIFSWQRTHSLKGAAPSVDAGIGSPLGGRPAAPAAKSSVVTTRGRAICFLTADLLKR